MAVAGRRWGRHLLRSTWADRIVRGAGVRAGQLVLDLGAGTGALTAPLVDQGARTVAVELHAGRAAVLRRRFGERSVTVIEADILEVPLPGRPFRVVANPPYAVGAALVRRLTDRRSHLVRADLVVPRWMARRYEASPPRGFSALVGQHVPARAFDPAPRSDSAVLILRRSVAGRRTRSPSRRR
ncbi:rRNA adenine N-6-methyltransferase family protein [Ornithinimicrobium faecis]|uniref:rRNA adenine N-6-methyltransferase family protein n=1 Tax=Ornithinimicrobium faecis TaxID=2934158 RepID=UPI0021199D6F|nr:rRNA adenine N-6-methyltransferase family protein [Ornithinimicrobium sp. HY1745]